MFTIYIFNFKIPFVDKENKRQYSSNLEHNRQSTSRKERSLNAKIYSNE